MLKHDTKLAVLRFSRPVRSQRGATVRYRHVIQPDRISAVRDA